MLHYDDEKIKELWLKNKTITEIATSIGVGRKALGKHIHKLIDEGFLAEKESTAYNKLHSHEDKVRICMDMNSKGKTDAEIMAELHISAITLQKYYTCIRKSGFIVNKNGQKPKAAARKFTPQPKEVSPTQHREPVTPTLAEGETVACNRTVSRKCVYGCDGTYESGTCRYILCTHYKRPCPASACTVFSQRSRKNPKLKSLGE